PAGAHQPVDPALDDLHRAERCRRPAGGHHHRHRGDRGPTRDLERVGHAHASRAGARRGGAPGHRQGCGMGQALRDAPGARHHSPAVGRPWRRQPVAALVARRPAAPARLRLAGGPVRHLLPAGLAASGLARAGRH
ncbi:hypothetical protein KXX11_004512, partial [Aspergillus fumigatus]